MYIVVYIYNILLVFKRKCDSNHNGLTDPAEEMESTTYFRPYNVYHP